MRDPVKQRKAAERIAACMRAGTGVVSTQVLLEYANTALVKLKQDEAIVLRTLRLLESLTVIITTPALVRHAVELRKLHNISFWDAGILAAAEESGCDTLLSEDFNPGQYYGGIKVVNPFAG